jgi:hypothetical protein
MKPLSLLKIALLGSTMMPGIITSDTAFAGSVGGFGGATEFTQILNNAQLAGIQLKNIQQVANQITQINNQIQQISYALKSYNNMIQNTASLPGTGVGKCHLGAEFAAVAGSARGVLSPIIWQMSTRLSPRASRISRPIRRVRSIGQITQPPMPIGPRPIRTRSARVLKTAGLQEGQFANEQATLQQLENMKHVL